MKCVSSVSFTQETSSSYLQETAKARLCDHRQTWHALSLLSFSLICVLEFIGWHIPITSISPDSRAWSWGIWKGSLYRRFIPAGGANWGTFPCRGRMGVLGLCSGYLLSSDVTCKWISADDWHVHQRQICKGWGRTGWIQEGPEPNGALARWHQRTLSFTRTWEMVSANLSFNRLGKQCSKTSACRIVSQHCFLHIRFGGSIQALVLS